MLRDDRDAARGGVPLLTVGHGTLRQDELAELLTGAGVGLLIDVRRYPSSRRHPQSSAGALRRWLPAHGIEYRWNEALGGRRRGAPDSPHVVVRNASFRAYADHMDTPQWRAAFEQTMALAAANRVALMCSEAVWWRCHRRFIADAAEMLCGAEVRHLMHDGRRDRHHPTSGARVAGERLIYDGGCSQPDLFEGDEDVNRRSERGDLP